MGCRAWLSLRLVEQRRDALPDADAERGEADARFRIFGHDVHERRDDACTGAADGVAEGDGAAVEVHAFGIEIEAADACDALRGEGFVELDGIEVRGAKAGAREKLLRRGDGALAHVVRIDAGGRARDPAEPGFDAELFYDRFAREEQDRKSVV